MKSTDRTETTAPQSKLDRKRIVTLARPEWVPLTFGTIALVIASASSLAAPTMVGHLVDGVTEGAGREALDRAALILLGVFAISGVASPSVATSSRSPASGSWPDSGAISTPP